MGAEKKINDSELVLKLAKIFANYGFEGTSISLISAMTGLKKPSLYHRFPEGKEQMAREVLAFADKCCGDFIFSAVAQAQTPQAKVEALAKGFAKIYDNGSESCVMNMLTPPRDAKSEFAKIIASMFATFITQVAAIAVAAGISRKQAEVKAEQVVTELQGALVLSRGLGNSGPFKRMLERLPQILLAG